MDSAKTRTDLRNLMQISVDGSDFVEIGLEHLVGLDGTNQLSGQEIADELTNVINERFGDGKKFDPFPNREAQIPVAMSRLMNACYGWMFRLLCLFRAQRVSVVRHVPILAIAPEHSKIIPLDGWKNQVSNVVMLLAWPSMSMADLGSPKTST